jgi:hypothetical protein
MMRATLPVAITLAVALVGLAAPAAAQPRRGSPSSGYFAELGLGATGFLGETQRHAAIGPTFAFRGGKDLTRWFSVGGLIATSVHEATVPPPPEQEYFQLYTLAGDARLTVRTGRLALFAEGGAGFTVISTNVLDRVGVTTPEEHTGFGYHAGGGVAWHTQNRHFSVGLAADWWMVPSFAASMAVDARLYLRYTK